jgi:N-carbamoyl-L-amino-acid hydrolase
MEVTPNSPNTVPSKVEFSIDLRHPDAALLARLGDSIAETVQATASGRRCEAEVKHVSHVPPTVFSDTTVGLIRTATEALQYRYLEMPSGAGHDAMYLNRVCPTGMIFVPCLRGVSHNEAESATAEDLAAGARVLAQTLVALAGS